MGLRRIRLGLDGRNTKSSAREPGHCATPKGLIAREVWHPLPAEVEARWRERIGKDAMFELKGSLAAIVSNLDPDVPDCMPILGYGLKSPAPIRLPRPASEDPGIFRSSRCWRMRC